MAVNIRAQLLPRGRAIQYKTEQSKYRAIENRLHLNTLGTKCSHSPNRNKCYYTARRKYDSGFVITKRDEEEARSGTDNTDDGTAQQEGSIRAKPWGMAAVGTERRHDMWAMAKERSGTKEKKKPTQKQINHGLKNG